MTLRRIAPFIAAVFVGAVVAWIDTRPGWDDTGITVGLLLLGSACIGVMHPKPAWLVALSAGMWLPLWNIASGGNMASLAALPVAFAGVYAGLLARTALRGDV